MRIRVSRLPTWSPFAPAKGDIVRTVRIRVWRLPTWSPFRSRERISPFRKPFAGAKGDYLLARKVAALPGKSDIVWVRPPFSASGPRSRSAGVVRMMLPSLPFLIPPEPPREMRHAMHVISLFVATAVLTTDEAVSEMR